MNYIMHRDMKFENMAFSERDNIETLKIFDFGLAAFCKDRL